MNLEKIKFKANENGITLTDLAQKCDMSYQNLNRCVKNNKISANDLEKIADVLEVPVGYFFGEVGPEAAKKINQTNSNLAVGNGNRQTVSNDSTKEAGQRLETCEKILIEKDKQLAEKDARIMELKEMIDLLKNK